MGAADTITLAFRGATGLDAREPAIPRPLGVTTHTLDDVRMDVFAKFCDGVAKLGDLGKAASRTKTAHATVGRERFGDERRLGR